MQPVNSPQLSNLSVHPQTLYEIECWRDGILIWTEKFPNLVTTAGKNKLLTMTFISGAVTPTWYIGLVSSTGFTVYAAADTMASHAGWTESVIYSAGTRPAYTVSPAAAGSIANDVAKAVFTINATGTIRGAFLADNSTKSGTTGTLYGVGDFVAVRSVIIGDVLNVQATLTVT